MIEVPSPTGGMVPVGDVIRELVRRAASKEARAQTRQKNTARLECVQLELRFPPAAPAAAFDPERPLADLFPEA